MVFPMSAPYTDPLKVLICGGSTPGPAIVLDNCVSIEPEVDGATWTVERMVRVLLFQRCQMTPLFQALSSRHALHVQSSRWNILDGKRSPSRSGRIWISIRP